MSDIFSKFRLSLRGLPWVRWGAYVVATTAFLVYMRRESVRVIPLALETQYSDRCFVCQPPTECPFGHKTIVEMPVVYGSDFSDEAWRELERKIENLEAWYGGAGCISIGPDTMFACKMCRFAYDGFNGREWSRRVGVGEQLQGQFFRLSEFIANTPVPQTGSWAKRVAYRQTVKHGGVWQGALPHEYCLFWTDEAFEDVVSKMQAYVAGRGIGGMVTEPLSDPTSTAGRIYFYAYAQVGLRYMRLEIMREVNEQVCVKLELVTQPEARRDWLMKKALKL